MSTDDIEDYFNQISFKIKKIFWLNDFCCVIEFDCESLALEAFKKLTGLPLEEENKQNYDWKSSLPFFINDEAQELFIRISEKDV